MSKSIIVLDLVFIMLYWIFTLHTSSFFMIDVLPCISTDIPHIKSIWVFVCIPIEESKFIYKPWCTSERTNFNIFKLMVVSNEFIEDNFCCYAKCEKWVRIGCRMIHKICIHALVCFFYWNKHYKKYNFFPCSSKLW